jgi:hypothetical protein
MAITQMQIIQSLGEAMAWFEREQTWGVPATELRHLIGRIGELYAALITNGQMATKVNQKGYDVVSGDGERISVKTTAMMGTTGHIAFNSNTLDVVDRIIILRINTDEMQIETLLNYKTEVAKELMRNVSGNNRKAAISLSKLLRPPKSLRDITVLRAVTNDIYTIKELENGSIEVLDNNSPVIPAKPVLRLLAKRLNINILNSNGNPYNTRQLGSLVIKAIEE